MNFQIRSNYTAEPEKVVAIEPEEIAGQVIGSRLQFVTRHDITFQFANGAVVLDNIELIIYIMPNQFFCYCGDDVLGTIILESHQFDIDLRESVNGTNGRAFVRVIK